MIKAETLIRISKEEAAIIMRKKSEIQKENEEFVKTYDDSQYPKPSVTVDIVIFGMFDLKEDNYRKISEKKLKVLLIQRGEAPYEGCYALPGGFVHPEETIYKAAERELKEETNLNCNFLEPVSYTHLDVYKRQVKGIR